MYPKTIIDLLQSAAVEHKDKVLYEDEAEAITFAQTLDLTKKIATQVTKATSQANVPVAVWTNKSIRVPAMYMGVLYAGCHYVPLGADVPVFRVKSIFEIVKPQALIVDGISDDLVNELNFKGKIIRLGECETIIETLIAPRVNALTNTDPQYIIFTSGSTGQPKGVVTSHLAVIDYITTFADTFEISDTSVFGNQAPLEYIAGIRDMFIPLYKGCKTVILPKNLFSQPVKLFERVAEKHVNVICWVSPAFNLIYELDAFASLAPTTIKKLFFTGSSMQPKVYNYIRKYLPEALIANHYGPTEITASCTYYETVIGESYENGIPIGKPFKNRRVFLLDSDNRLITTKGEKGEICVSGNCIANGYYLNPEKTNEVFVQNPLHNNYTEIIYRTGDVGAYLDDEVLMFHGRQDNQIKHMGHRIELGEVEIAASNCDNAGECACLYDYDKNTICLFYTGTASLRDLTIQLRQKLPSYMIPRKIHFLEAIPLMFNGKTDRTQLKKLMSEK